MNKFEFNKVFKDKGFVNFDKNPVASAFIGQVNSAYLNGTKVAIKLRKYNINKIVKTEYLENYNGVKNILPILVKISHEPLVQMRL